MVAENGDDRPKESEWELGMKGNDDFRNLANK